MSIVIQKDRANQSFTEIKLENDEYVRVTLVGQSWAGESGIRIQIRDLNGHLRQGPEIPISALGDTIAGIIKLSFTNTNGNVVSE